MGFCSAPGGSCHIVCHGPAHHAVKHYCDNQCTSRRQLSESDEFCYTSGACDGMSGTSLEACMAGAQSDDGSGGGGSDGNVDASESAVSGGDGIVLTMLAIVVTRIRRKKVGQRSEPLFRVPLGQQTVKVITNPGQPMLIIPINSSQKANPELQAALDTEEDLHGGVAKRMERIESGRPVNPLRRAGTDTNFVGVENEGVETPYALA
ncbi:MAG: hypothetical protein SGARI_003594 [Bacillariaceae sp.]